MTKPYSEKVIIESKTRKKIPAISIVNAAGEELKHTLYLQTYITIDDKQRHQCWSENWQNPKET